MKYRKIFRTLAVVLTLALLVAVMPATPALAAAGMEIDPDEGEIGDTIDVYGFGFTAGSIVYIYFSSETVAVGEQVDDETDVYEIRMG